MLEVTGYLKGKQYDEEVVNAEQLLKIMGTPLNLNQKQAVFTLLPQHTKSDPQNRRVRHQGRRRFTTLISGEVDGNYVTVRYYERKRKTKDGVVYDPARVEHSGLEMSLKTASEKEKIAFLMLCGACKDSPIKTKSTAYYELTDKAAKAQNDLLQESLVASLIVTINNASDVVLKRLARAVKFTGQATDGQRYSNKSIPNVNTSSITELKFALIKLAKLFPKDFSAAFNDQDILMRGMIKEANDMGVIVQKQIGGGLISWEWRSDINGGAQICTARTVEDPFSVLYKHVLKPDVFEFFTETVNSALNYTEAEATLSSMNPIAVDAAVKGGKADPKEMTPMQMIDFALQGDLIYFDRGQEKVFLIKDGEVETKALHVVKEPKAWKLELAKAIGSNDLKKNKLLALLK